MNTKKTTALLVLATAFVLAGCASNRGDRRERPEPSPERKTEIYQRFLTLQDIDGDGEVTCADIQRERALLFGLLDVDDSKSLIRSEYRYAKFEDKSFMFHAFLDVDTDISGGISLAELSAVSDSQFTAADQDANCIISKEEAVTAAQDHFQGKPGSKREPDGRSREGRRGGERGQGGQRPNGITNPSSS